MRKFLLLLAVCCSLTMFSKGQGARFGFNAGILSSTAKITSDNQTSSSKGRIGFNVGVLVDVMMGKDFSFQPGLNFVQKGGKDDEGDQSVNISLNFLELPLNFIYHAKGKTGSFLIGAGPSVSYGLSGKAKVTAAGLTVTQTLHLGSSENDDLKRLEFGGNVLAGYEWKNGVLISFNYNIGLSNMSPQSGTTWKNYYAGLHVGFVLPDKRH